MQTEHLKISLNSYLFIVKKGRDHKLIVGSVAGSDPTDFKYPTGGF